MLTFEEKKVVAPAVPQRLNDIPAGKVFFATVHIVEKNGQVYPRSGVWVKTNTDSKRHNTHAVCLTGHDTGPYIAVQCEKITDYRELVNPRIIEEVGNVGTINCATYAK